MAGQETGWQSVALPAPPGRRWWQRCVSLCSGGQPNKGNYSPGVWVWPRFGFRIAILCLLKEAEGRPVMFFAFSSSSWQHRNPLRSCRREVCPQEGKDDLVIEIMYSEGLHPLPPCIFSGIEAPFPFSFVGAATNGTVHFSDAVSNHLLISQNVAWRFWDNIIRSILSQDPLPKQFERVLVFILFVL